MKVNLELTMGNTTCADKPGNFCMMVRTTNFGQSFVCQLFEERLFHKDGWLTRCEQCLKEFPPEKEGEEE